MVVGDAALEHLHDLRVRLEGAQVGHEALQVRPVHHLEHLIKARVRVRVRVRVRARVRVRVGVRVRANPCITLSILRLARTASASRPRRLSEVTACAPRTQCLRDMQKTMPGSICADASACVRVGVRGRARGRGKGRGRGRGRG